MGRARPSLGTKPGHSISTSNTAQHSTGQHRPGQARKTFGKTFGKTKLSIIYIYSIQIEENITFELSHNYSRPPTVHNNQLLHEYKFEGRITMA